MNFSSKGEEYFYHHYLESYEKNKELNIIHNYNLQKISCPYRIFTDFMIFYKEVPFLAFEINGEQHGTPLYGNENFIKQRLRDRREFYFLRKKHIELMHYEWFNGHLYDEGMRDDGTSGLYDDGQIGAEISFLIDMLKEAELQYGHAYSLKDLGQWDFCQRQNGWHFLNSEDVDRALQLPLHERIKILEDLTLDKSEEIFRAALEKIYK